jgi:periplasmic protein TonB
MTDAEVFYPREATGRFFTISLVAHAGIAAALLITGALSANRLGSPHASSGSVGINAVASIPMPHRAGPENPLAHNSESTIPTLVEKPRPAAKEIEQNAIPIPNKFEKQKKSPRPPAPTAYKPPTPYKDNQLYSHTPQATTSNMYGMKGAGGIDIGPASVLGSRFGAYVELMRDRISQHWNTADVRSLPAQKCAITFTIARNGAVSNVQVSQPSGNYLLDTSAKRAVIDANPLPALPQELQRNDVTVELWFQVQK